MSKEHIVARVAAGARLLDQTDADWPHDIDLNKLDLADPRHCVLGYVYGGFHYGQSFLASARQVDMAAHGFFPECGDGLDDNFTEADAEYQMLTAAWKDEIRVRLQNNPQRLKVAARNFMMSFFSRVVPFLPAFA